MTTSEPAIRSKILALIARIALLLMLTVLFWKGGAWVDRIVFAGHGE
jgi:hypothetical protein